MAVGRAAGWGDLAHYRRISDNSKLTIPNKPRSERCCADSDLESETPEPWARMLILRVTREQHEKQDRRVVLLVLFVFGLFLRDFLAQLSSQEGGTKRCEAVGGDG